MEDRLCPHRHHSRGATALGTRDEPSLHHLTTRGAKQIVNRPVIGMGLSRPVRLFVGVRSAEYFSQACQASSQARAKEAVVTDLGKPFWQNMLEKAANEFFGRKKAGLGLSGLSGLVAKSHLTIAQINQPMVADGYSKDVGSQIFER